MPLYALCYPDVSETDAQFIREFRKQHDVPYRDVVDFHFTMVFGTKDVDEQAFVNHVSDIARSQKPIDFVCRYAMLGNDDSSDNYYSFLVPDEGYSDISKLHDRLYTGILEPFLR